MPLPVHVLTSVVIAVCGIVYGPWVLDSSG